MLNAATDGSALGNPGPGGWCWFIHPGLYATGGHPGPVTNNQMELTALLRLLEHAPGDDLRISIDSQYVINAATKWAQGWAKNGWKTKSGTDVANRGLVQPILELMTVRAQSGLVTDIVWVRGHSGHPANEAADSRARASAERARDSGSSFRQQPPSDPIGLNRQ